MEFAILALTIVLAWLYEEFYPKLKKALKDWQEEIGDTSSKRRDDDP